MNLRNVFTKNKGVVAIVGTAAVAMAIVQTDNNRIEAERRGHIIDSGESVLVKLSKTNSIGYCVEQGITEGACETAIESALDLGEGFFSRGSELAVHFSLESISDALVVSKVRNGDGFERADGKKAEYLSL